MENLKLETEVCSRCGGTGRYSYNALHGDRCYGCGGAGVRYTKRGAVAAAFLKTLRQVRADTVKPGDRLRVQLVQGSKVYTVETVSIGLAKDHGAYRGDGQYMQVKIEFVGEGVNKLRAYHDPAHMVDKVFSDEEKTAQLRQAVEYQATLTKAGTPRKRA